MAILAAISFSSVLYIIYAALGLGLVIFFHELGHFAVAKWCRVYVERFSIGFGPILLRYKRGDTEYVLSAIPFGGYVKMLGQDDMDPSQLSSEQIAADPRSYSAKSVPQRMAIISAGVIMNVITGVLFFAMAFGSGVKSMPPVIGGVQVGKPAWTAGIQYGDRIDRINNREVSSFNDVQRGVALTRGPVTIEGTRLDGTTYEVTVMPELGTRRQIGVVPANGLTLAKFEDQNAKSVVANTAAARAEPPFEPGDTIRKVGGVELESFAQLQSLLAVRNAETLDFEVQRDGSENSDLIALRVSTNRFRTLGFRMDIGKIAAVQSGSPADVEGLRKGDRITEVNGKEIGKEINPIRLPDYFAKVAGQEVELTVSRPTAGGEPTEITVRITPTDKPGWTDRPSDENVPLAIPSVGIAYHLIPVILQVEKGSAADGKIFPGERLKSVEFIVPPVSENGESEDDVSEGAKPIEIKFGKKDEKTGEEIKNWAFAFWMMQALPDRVAKLTVSGADGKIRTVELTPKADPNGDWFLPTRGIRLMPDTELRVAASVPEALQMGVAYSSNTMSDICLTLRNLVDGQLSVKELHGPLGIATVAYRVARQGISDLLLFLGFLSINLAVLNFLPIPVLDGGHMVFLCWEAITRKRPSERVMVAATYFGMAFVLGLMILVLYLDIFVHKMGIN